MVPNYLRIKIDHFDYADLTDDVGWIDLTDYGCY